MSTSNIVVLGPCNGCDRLVTKQQAAFKCHKCRKWRHRTCHTGISSKDYQTILQLVKKTNKAAWAWCCPLCLAQTEDTEESSIVTVPASSPAVVTDTATLDSMSTIHGEGMDYLDPKGENLVDEVELDPMLLIDELSLPTSNVEVVQQSGSEDEIQYCTDHESDVSAMQQIDDVATVMEINCAQEMSCDDISQEFKLITSSDSVVKRSDLHLLIDSHGYSYLPVVTYGTRSASGTRWRCTSHPDQCHASVMQMSEDEFVRDSSLIHNHEPNPTMAVMGAGRAEKIDEVSNQDVNYEDHEINGDSVQDNITCTLIECNEKGTKRKLGELLVQEVEQSIEPGASVRQEVYTSIYTHTPEVEDFTDCTDVESIPRSADGTPKSFEIIKGGTTKNCDILIDNEGFTYTTMKQSKSQTKQGVIPWICSVRGEKYSCYAKIKQVQGSFRSVHDHHNHNIKLCEPQKIKVRCMIRDLLAEDKDESMSVDEIMSKAIENALTSDERVKLSNAPHVIDQLKRIILRERWKNHPPEVKVDEESPQQLPISDRDITYKMLSSAFAKEDDLMLDSLGYLYKRGATETIVTSQNAFMLKKDPENSFPTGTPQIKSFTTWKCAYMPTVPKPSKTKRNKRPIISCRAYIRELDTGAFTRSYIRHKHGVPNTTNHLEQQTPPALLVNEAPDAGPSVDPTDASWSVDQNVTHEVIPGGSTKGEDILVDSIGFTYNSTRISKNPDVRHWSCSVRNKDMVCCAKVNQLANHTFLRSKTKHNHETRLNNALMIKARMLVKLAVQKDTQTPSIVLVKSVVADLLRSTPSLDDTCVNWENLRRIANRTRQKQQRNVHSYCIAENT